MHSKNYLKELRENLDRYNSIPNVQQTNCLAYVQENANIGKNMKRRKAMLNSNFNNVKTEVAIEMISLYIGLELKNDKELSPSS